MQVALAKIRSFKFPKRSEMAELQNEWITATGGIPIGNQPGTEWAQTIKVCVVFSTFSSLKTSLQFC